MLVLVVVFNNLNCKDSPRDRVYLEGHISTTFDIIDVNNILCKGSPSNWHYAI